ncbi:MAG: tetratricopeptide repeat protein, partial [Gemmatimonadaceae bacterium]
MSESAERRWETQNELGCKLFGQGDLPQAEEAFIAAIREATLLGTENLRLASSLSNLVQLKYKQTDFHAAESLFRRALAIREQVLGAEHQG